MNVPIDISDINLRTERLLLRPWKQSDSGDLFEYASVDGVGQMAGWEPHESVEQSRQIIEMFISGKKTFALEYEGKVIGSLGIEKYDEEKFPEFAGLRCREIGFVLSKYYWGRGFMPEAVNEAVRYLFEELKLDAIFCGRFKSNLQSARVQAKCGFTRYALEKRETQRGTTEDGVFSILRRRDWELREKEDI